MDSKYLALIAVLALASVYLPSEKQEEHPMSSAFYQFKHKYSKTYSSDEEPFRFQAYVQNMKRVEEHNAGSSSYTMAENKFTDFTQEEFKTLMNGVLPQDPNEAQVAIHSSKTFIGDVNWVTKGAVQSVKDQGICGSCWAFSAAAVCESADAVYNGHLGDFSEKQLMDCMFTTGGCNGGWPSKSLTYYVDAGFCTEASYPYDIYIDHCHTDPVYGPCTYTSPQFNITGYVSVEKGSVSSLKSALDKQPVSICVDTQNWLNYAGGIFDTCPQNPGQDHAVLAVGYTSDYVLVKNSWGVSWGDSGYIRITTATDDCCGIADTAIYPTV